MIPPPAKRPPPELLADRLAHIRSRSEELIRRNAELSVTLAQARIRRSEVRAERTKLRSDMILRRAVGTADGRAAAALLEAAVHVSGISVGELWLDYVALGGNHTAAEVCAMVEGRRPLNRAAHDRLALAVNERMAEAGHGRLVAYWDGSR